ncbi:MAG: hypothetical protein K2J80_01755 [Oscillospiraceae bacterium]|nr:hypothetical protein [Oscillospiraceae bacterium]
MSNKRKIAFTVIAVILSLITLWIAAGYCSVITKPLINTGDIEDINIDGSDFTFIFKAGAFVLNGIIMAAFIVVMLIIELVIMPAAWGIFRYFAFKKNPAADAEELSYAWRLFLISALGTLAAALVFMIVYAVRAKSGAPFAALMFCWLNPLLMYAFYISKLKKSV